MNVRAIETVRNPAWSNLLWVRVETEDGLVGLGETFRHAGPIERYVHEHIAPYLLGRDALAVNAHAHALLHDGGTRFLGYPTRSVEIRANSAVDIALWDLRGRATGLSLTALLGGPARTRVRIYNTCASVDCNALAGVDRARRAGTRHRALRRAARTPRHRDRAQRPMNPPTAPAPDAPLGTPCSPFPAPSTSPAAGGPSTRDVHPGKQPRS